MIRYPSSVMYTKLQETKLSEYRVTKPGGWLQLVECYYMCQSDNGSIGDTNALRRWSDNYIRALDSTKDPRSALQLQNMLVTAGLQSVETRMIPVPLCAWSSSKSCPSKVQMMGRSWKLYKK